MDLEEADDLREEIGMMRVVTIAAHSVPDLDSQESGDKNQAAFSIYPRR